MLAETERIMTGPSAGLRVCSSCRMALPWEAFSPRARGRDGLEAACKACESERLQLRRHGLTSLDKELIAAAQNGCALCGRLEPGKKGWVVDHDRACCSGDLSCSDCRRAVVCQWCNNALGYALDDPAVLRRMADYLELGTRLGPVERLSHLPISPTESVERVLRTENTDGLTENLLTTDTSLDFRNAHARIRRNTR